jgi:ABC-type multidrug transport system permease subunit
VRGALRVFGKDLLELAQNRQLLAFLLGAPLLLLFLVGQIWTQNLDITVFVVADPDRKEEIRALRAVLDQFADVKVKEQPSRPGNLLAWLEGAGADGAVVWENGWRVYTHQTDRYKLHRIMSLAQDIWISNEKAPKLPISLLKSATARDLVVFFPPASVRDMTAVPPLTGLVAVFLPFLLASGTYVREREAGMLETLLLASGGRWGWLFAGKVLTPVLIGALAFLLMVVLARSWFGYGIKSGLLLLGGLLFVAMITSALLGLAVSTLVRSQQQAHVLSAIYLLGLILLTGFVYPLEQAAWMVRAVSWVFPLTMLVRPLDAWLSRGADPALFPLDALGLGVQCVAALVLICFCVARTRRGI